MNDNMSSKAMKGYEIIKCANISFRVFSESLPQETHHSPSGPLNLEQCKETLFLPSSAMGSIIGHKGNNIKAIRTKSRANISLETKTIPSNSPSGEDTSENIAVVSGTSRQVKLAISMLEEYISKSDTKSPTHFLSIPLRAKAFVKNVEQFQNELGSYEDSQLKSSWFLAPLSIHLTLGMLVLKNAASIDNASKLLSSLKSTIYKITKGEPIDIDMQGLGHFPEGKIENARVLYAKVKANCVSYELLKQLADCVRNKFKQAGLLMDCEKEFVFHATLYKAREDAGKFPIKPILDKFRDFPFGKSSVSEIQLCTLGRFESDGSHSAASSLSLV